ncbi:unnamed protein product [Adineta ricciae]|uniref:Uncharacterized protein n=1 Tax=Adineta ricciae TaxID=249248 RepID=A0A815JYY0_ADIRI|nr:unnamed protein product [Adineta ricciae]CAF1384218.1 unnamed protein product [Adineta ricciae]
MFKKNEIYSDELSNENETIELINPLGENKKFSTESQFTLEELLIKSRQLNSSKSFRLIDQQIETLPKRISSSIESVNLSANLLNKNEKIQWKDLSKQIQHLELSGNFLDSLQGIETRCDKLQSLGISFNEISSINQIFFNEKWSNLYSLDLSYNLLNNLSETIESLSNLNQLRILYLHGNPFSLIVDYRLFVIDSLHKLHVLDDIPITTEERFRARTFSNCNSHPKDYSKLTITISNLMNIPQPPINQDEWPLQVHRFKFRFQWFNDEEEEKKEINVPFDKFADFNRFHSSYLEFQHSDYKPTMEFSPNFFNLTIKSLVQFRDFLFHGTKCEFIHQLTEYWPPGEPNDDKASKKKSNQNSDKKVVESPPKKKRNEDLNKLVIRKDPIETILTEFHVELRSFLDGDHQILFPYKCFIQQNLYPIIEKEILPTKSKKDLKKTDSIKEKAKEKSKDKIMNINEENPQPFQCSIHFKLFRFVSDEELI